jgi:hypothetical protein
VRGDARGRRASRAARARAREQSRILSAVVRWPAALAIAAGCGRFGFDAPAASGDANPHTDGSIDAPADAPAVNFVFVTSTRQKAGALGSLAAADSMCQGRAQAAGLAGTYVAWLSTSTTNAKDRLGNARGWVRVDGLPFADTVADIVAGRLRYPIALDELGGKHDFSENVPLVTNTLETGTAMAGQTCNDLTAPGATGITAMVGAESTFWTHNGAGANCNNDARYYCFGVDHATPLPPLSLPQRIAFVSRANWLPNGGLAGADAQCAADAAAAGLPGTFRALLSTPTASAASRFALAGTPWTRPDGAIVTTAFEAPIAPIVQRADGTLANTSTLTGGADPTAIGTAASTCANWTDATAGATGDAGLSMCAGVTGYRQATFQCNSGFFIYCFQQ